MGKKAEKEAELEKQAAKKAEKEAKKAAARARKEARKDAKAAEDGEDGDGNEENIFEESNVNEWTDEEQLKLNEALAKVPSNLDKKERWKAISEIVESRSMKVFLSRPKKK